MNATVKDLLQQARAGDSEAFATLFQEHAPGLWKIAASVMGNEADAADMLQETAIKAWRAIPGFDGRSKLGTWLARILLNTCYDELRSTAKVVPFDELAPSVDGGAGTPLWQGAPADEAAAQCLRLDVHASLERLSPDDRLVLTLFYVNDLPGEDIAAILGTTEGAVRTRLSRARARFKALYTEPDPKAAKTAPDYAEVME